MKKIVDFIVNGFGINLLGALGMFICLFKDVYNIIKSKEITNTNIISVSIYVFCILIFIITYFILRGLDKKQNGLIKTLDIIRTGNSIMDGKVDYIDAIKNYDENDKVCVDTQLILTLYGEIATYKNLSEIMVKSLPKKED